MSDDFSAMLRHAAAANAIGGSTASTFAEEPVPLSVFVQDARYLANPPLSQVQYEAVRHIERIYYPATYQFLAAEFETGQKPGALHVGPYSSWRFEPYWSIRTRLINFATLQWGKGSGKDHVCRVSSLRIAYLLLCLESPQRYYNMPDQDEIHLLNVASTAQQAQMAFFQPCLQVVRRKNSWFKGRCAAKQNLISFDKGVRAVSGHSDAESQEGLNLMLGIADEIDAFKTRAEKTTRRVGAREPTKSAEGILDMMRTSGATRFPEVYKNVRISYPRHMGSKIQELTREALKDIHARGDIDSRHYVSGPKATWEVNPRIKGKEAFADDYASDPIMARAKYECRPARAVNPYFRNAEVVEASFNTVPKAPLTIDYEHDAQHGKHVWVPRYTFSPDLYPIAGAAYAMHADLAVSADRAGIAMAHVARYAEHETFGEDDEGTPHPIFELRPHITVDFCVSFTSDFSVEPPREIQIRWARQLCMELRRRGFNIVRLSFDKYQSRDSMQILETAGVECPHVSTDTTEDLWRTLRDLMSEGRVRIPRPLDATGEPANLLVREEILSLSRSPNGKVDHPFDGTKDEADALAGAVYGAVEIGGQEDPNGTRVHYTPADFSVGTMFAMPLGVRVNQIFESSIPEL